MNVGDELRDLESKLRFRRVMMQMVAFLAIIALGCAVTYVATTWLSAYNQTDYLQYLLHSPCTRPGG